MPYSLYTATHIMETAGPMNSYPDSESITQTCLQCNGPISHSACQLWCIKCRCAKRRRGQTRGLAQSMQTRRLKAWLRRFPGS